MTPTKLAARSSARTYFFFFAMFLVQYGLVLPGASGGFRFGLSTPRSLLCSVRLR
jgi:hypothetical protein